MEVKYQFLNRNWENLWIFLKFYDKNDENVKLLLKI